MNTRTHDKQHPAPNPSSTYLRLERRDGQIAGHTRVDTTDATLLSQWTWRLSSDGYAVRSETRNGSKKTIYLHRVVIQAPPGTIVDHINGDRLDNRRANLRLVTPSQNNANGRDRPRRSGYRGVYPHRPTGRWIAQISVSGRVRHLGIFDDPLEAARAYDLAAHEQWGSFARHNGFARRSAASESTAS